MQAAVLKRASYKDILVFKNDASFLNSEDFAAVIATSSIRRKAQWLHRYPNHAIEVLRGNVNTRLQKVTESNIKYLEKNTINKAHSSNFQLTRDTLVKKHQQGFPLQ